MLYYHDLCVCGYHIRAIIHHSYISIQSILLQGLIHFVKQPRLLSELKKIGARPGHAKNGRAVGCVTVSFHAAHTPTQDTHAHRSRRSVWLCVTLPASLELCVTVSRRALSLQERDTLMNGQFMVLSSPVRLWGNRGDPADCPACGLADDQSN